MRFSPAYHRLVSIQVSAVVAVRVPARLGVSPKATS